MNHDRIFRFLNHVALLKSASRAVVFNRYEVPIAITEHMPPEFALQVVALCFPEEEEVLQIKPWEQCTLDEQRHALKCPLHDLAKACSLIRIGVLEVPESYAAPSLERTKTEVGDCPTNRIAKESWKRAMRRRNRISKINGGGVACR